MLVVISVTRLTCLEELCLVQCYSLNSLFTVHNILNCLFGGIQFLRVG